MPLILVSIAFISGVLSSSIHLPWAFFSFTGFILLLLFFFLRKRRKLWLLLFVCLFAFVGGSVYDRCRLPANGTNHLQFYNNQSSIEITGVVSRDPEENDKSIQLEISAASVNLSENIITGNFLVIIPKVTTSTNYGYGDLLRIQGQLETPPSIEGFDYKAYLNNQGIYSIMYSPKVQIVEKAHGFKPLALVFQLRKSLSRSLAQTLPEPQGSLAQGIILGLRGTIPADVENQFIRTGTAHLLAISGVNLTIMAAILISFGVAVFGRRYQIYAWLAIFTIWFYAVITGFQPPVVRAAIMASSFLVTELLGRQRSSIVSLIIAATIMVIFTPELVHDASFQLSVMSMVGLILVAPPLQSLIKLAVKAALPDNFAKLVFPIADSLVVSLGSIIAIWPLIALYFGIISWVGPIASLLTVAAMPAVIVTGSTCAILGIIVMPLSQIIAWFVWLLLSYVLLIVRLADYFPASKVNSFPTQWMIAYYIVLALSLLAYYYKNKLAKSWERFIAFAGNLPLKPITLSLFLTAVLLFSTAATMPDNKLHVAFLDVGQGDAVLISQGSQQILTDGGPSGEALFSQISRNMPFWDRTIDLLILSHPHADHLTGLLELLKRYHVKEVLYSDFEYDSPQFTEWRALISAKNIEHIEAQAGQQITMGEVTVDILNPPKQRYSGTVSDIDNNSIVARVRFGEVSLLLTGDTQREAEAELIYQHAALDCDILKVGHHGSATSTSSQFLSVINPSVAVISVGANNDFGHPDNEVTTRLIQKTGEGNIFRTDKNGTIVFTTDGTKLWVSTDK